MPIIDLFTVRACALIMRRPAKTWTSHCRRVLTGWQSTGMTPRTEHDSTGGGTCMTQQRQAHVVISSEIARGGRSPTPPVHPGYAAIVAKAHVRGLPQCYPTDITIYDQLLIIQRQPREFAWLLHRCGSLLNLPEPNQRPQNYLHATRRIYGQALPFWWDGNHPITFLGSGTGLADALAFGRISRHYV
jgi:hypothetical protein